VGTCRGDLEGDSSGVPSQTLLKHARPPGDGDLEQKTRHQVLMTAVDEGHATDSVI